MTQAPRDPPYVFHPDLASRLAPVPSGEIVSELLHHDDGPGVWMRMAPGAHEPITAMGEAILLLTLLKD